MILLDTCVLIDALTGPRRSEAALREAFSDGERIAVTTIVLYEWWRGPRSRQELEAQEALFPSDSAIGFGPLEARRAAELYRSVKSPRGREVDLAVAACALIWDATLWTLNVRDFSDIKGLAVARPGTL
jgi:predicted nucleic acid-binding protein